MEAAMHATRAFSPRSLARLRNLLCRAALPLPLCACSGTSDPATEAPEFGPWAKGFHIPAEPQEAGDPVLGRETLLNGSYMSCGIPLKLFDNALAGPAVQAALGSGGDLNVPGREGRNATLPHTINAFTTAD